jgi:hypothetical protein
MIVYNGKGKEKTMTGYVAIALLALYVMAVVRKLPSNRYV